MKVDTIKIVADEAECGFITINQSNFNPDTMTEYEGSDEAAFESDPLVNDLVPSSDADPMVGMDKDAIIAKLTELEIPFNKNLGAKKLGKILAEATTTQLVPQTE